MLQSASPPFGGVNFQPVAFTGAASEDDVRKERITIPELAERIEEQTEGVIKKVHFYPVPLCCPDIEDGRGVYGQTPGHVHHAPALRCGDLCLRHPMRG